MAELDNANTVFNVVGELPIDEMAGSEQSSSLMQLIGQGNEAAFETIYDQYSPILYAICIRILKHEFEAREVLSEVFLEVWKKASRYDRQRGTVRAFLITLTRCRAIDYLRSRTSRSVNHDKLQSVWRAPESGKSVSEPLRSAVRQEQQVILLDAVNSLNERQKEVLKLAYFEGLTQSEIATSLQLPLGTVKTAMRRGLASLKDSLETTLSGDMNP